MWPAPLTPASTSESLGRIVLFYFSLVIGHFPLFSSHFRLIALLPKVKFSGGTLFSEQMKNEKWTMTTEK